MCGPSPGRRLRMKSRQPRGGGVSAAGNMPRRRRSGRWNCHRPEYSIGKQGWYSARSMAPRQWGVIMWVQSAGVPSGWAAPASAAFAVPEMVKCFAGPLPLPGIACPNEGAAVTRKIANASSADRHMRNDVGFPPTGRSRGKCRNGDTMPYSAPASFVSYHRTSVVMSEWRRIGERRRRGCAASPGGLWGQAREERVRDRHSPAAGCCRHCIRADRCLRPPATSFHCRSWPGTAHGRAWRLRRASAPRRSAGRASSAC